jgi:hypothetical protein
MARIILGMGTSHTPMLNAPPTDWPRFIERDSQRTNLLDTAGRLTSYDQQLKHAPADIGAQINPARMEARHALVQGAITRLGDYLREAKLDALIVVGDDQEELYQHQNMPGILVYYGETIRNVPMTPPPGEPSWGWKASARWHEEKVPRDYPVDTKLAQHLIDQLIEREFDVSASNGIEEGMGEGHAIGFVHRRIMQDVAQPVVPIVPVCVNTYYPPNQPTPRRCYRLGQAIRAAVEAYPKDIRVGIIASGGLSHFVVDEALDRGFIDLLRNRDADGIQGLPREKLNSGSSEIRNWIAVAGAVEHLSLEWSLYEPGYRTPAGTGTGLGFAYWT